jgi:ketosteroid isomerase-like protein
MDAEEFDRRVAALEARSQVLHDVAEIENLHRRYFRTIAAHEFAEAGRYFTDDAEVDLHAAGPQVGRAAYEELFGRLAALVTTPDGYVLSSPVVSVHGDEATGTWTWHRFQCEFEVMGGSVRAWGPWWEGRHYAEYRRSPAGWRIRRLRIRAVAPDPDPPDRAESLPAAPNGSRRYDGK